MDTSEKLCDWLKAEVEQFFCFYISMETLAVSHLALKHKISISEIWSLIFIKLKPIIFKGKTYLLQNENVYIIQKYLIQICSASKLYIVNLKHILKKLIMKKEWCFSNYLPLTTGLQY